MKIKKLLLNLCSLFAFLGIGFAISNRQTLHADQLLAADGLSTSSRQITTKRHLKVANLLTKISKIAPNKHVELQLTNRYDPDLVLIWANYELKPLPVANGRFFHVGDFQGQVMFAVVGAKTRAPVFETQGNKYVENNNQYLSVIGTLKGNGTKSAHKYYLTTGPKQASASTNLRQFQIVIDGLPEQSVNQLARYLKSSAKMPKFVTDYRHHHGWRPLLDWSIVGLLILILLILSVLIASADQQSNDNTQRQTVRWQNLFANESFRFLTFQGIMAFFAFLLLNWRLFFESAMKYGEILILAFILDAAAYFMTVIMLQRKKGTKRHAA